MPISFRSHNAFLPRENVTLKRSNDYFLGKGDKDGSTWLTAFVVKSFAEAAEFIAVDRQQVEESVRWLAAGQNDTGCFLKVGHQRRHLKSYSQSYLFGGFFNLKFYSEDTCTPALSKEGIMMTA